MTVKDGDNDAVSSCSGRSATPSPLRLSATRSGAEVFAFVCLCGGMRVLIVLSQRPFAKECNARLRTITAASSGTRVALRYGDRV